MRPNYWRNGLVYLLILTAIALLLWQIMGRKDLPLEENLEYDFFYIRNQSIFLDIAILVRTIPTVILGKGAY